MLAPADQAELVELVRSAHANETLLYPVGGGTSLDYGLAAKGPGSALSLAGLNRVIDYPARDMTITVEAGIRMSELARLMAAERQRLPIDAPQADEATLGGVIATNWSGPRRYGQGTIRDYVIGIRAVDGRGTEFNAGGRVVKNVAGYDFCKLLTGSMGTLGVISQVTLKVRPTPEGSALMLADVATLDEAERLLERLVHSQTTPTAIELLTGPGWHTHPDLGDATQQRPLRLLVGLEGTSVEVEWMLGQLGGEWRTQGIESRAITDAAAVERLWSALTEFPAEPGAALVVKANVVSSQTTAMIGEMLAIDPQASIQAHAGSGIVIARFAEMPAAGLLGVMIKRLQPKAAAGRGSAIVLSCTDRAELTHQAMWGPTRADAPLMAAVKQQFDPKNLLNRGRFVYYS
jgi:glycolate oxidase FAD binding subunit